MLQRNGEDIASKSVFNEANLKEHLRGKTADELIEELEKLYDEEELTGEEFDPRIVEIYIEAMEKVSPPDPAAERAFDRSWALFHTKHRVEKEPSSSHRAVKIRWRIEAAVLIVIFLCVSAAAFGWKDYIITWKDELFGTVPHIPGTMELKEPNVSGYRSLKEAVQKYTDISVVPGWIPPGYTIDEIYEMEVESADVISATYRDGQKSIAGDTLRRFDGFWAGFMVCCRFRTNSSDTPQMAYLPEPWTDLQVQWCLSVFSIYPRTHLWSWPAHFSSWEGRPFSAGRCLRRFLAFFPWLQLLFKDIFKKFLYDLSRPLLYIPSGVGRCLG
ncbi:hypothetical protein NE670_01920 [Flavonifractor plautii]|uniref:hypothetical protein n=1 Tax=Flavonifractor plautii TaxID=292800 RepID=UPI002109FF72|nr:hypothetical protein [Flavonifractor plautii]MCQ4784036.1 hypothetical protein [Flavonifractor plautii]